MSDSRNESPVDERVPGSVETDLELVAIVAMAENRVIGRDGDIPWHLPADLRRFKRVTMDHPVIMGRITHESIVERLGEPLPGRTSIVLTRSGSGTDEYSTPDGVLVADGIESAVRHAERAARVRHGGAKRAYVAGGESVYRQFLSLVDRLLVTEVESRPEGDRRFPEIPPAEWTETDRENRDGFAFVEYARA